MTKEQKLAKALRDLLSYTGGSDITDRSHPIFKARKALEDVDAADRLAKAFRAVIRRWLKPAELCEVDMRNKRWYLEEGSSCCATTDFCDANMAMDEAFNVAFGRPCRLKCGADTKLWGEAWTLAMKEGFSK